MKRRGPMSALALAAAPEPALIERRAPYPDFEVNPRMAPVSFASVRYDETVPVHADRALTLPGTSPTFKGFPLADGYVHIASLVLFALLPLLTMYRTKKAMLEYVYIP